MYNQLLRLGTFSHPPLNGSGTRVQYTHYVSIVRGTGVPYRNVRQSKVPLKVGSLVQESGPLSWVWGRSNELNSEPDDHQDGGTNVTITDLVMCLR